MQRSKHVRFRVWDEVMFYSGIIDDPSERYYLAQDGTLWCGLEQVKDPDVVVMMSTGLQDRNHKEIYDGDILEFDVEEWGDPTSNKWEVQWDRSQAEWQTGGGTNAECHEWKAIIGNRYENPELTKVVS